MTKEPTDEIQKEENKAIQMALMQQDIGYIKAKMDAFTKQLDNFGTQFVTNKEFQLVKSIVYGMVALIITAFIGGLIMLVFKIGVVAK